MTLNTVTYEQVLDMHPCWLETEEGCRRLKRYSDRLGGKATALDILRLNRIPADDRIWITLREEFIPAPILDEFACRCAERALSHIDNPDPRSVAGIAAKRQWLAGIITDEELDLAWEAAWDAERVAIPADAQLAACAAEHATRSIARYAAWTSSQNAARAAAWNTVWNTAWNAAYDAERKAQIDMLIEMLLEAQL